MDTEATEKPQPQMRWRSNGPKGTGIYCSCGLFKTNARSKVLAKWAIRHMERTGHQWKPAKP